MIRTYRYPLRQTKDQEAILDAWRVACQCLYNAALEERRDAWRKQRVSITRIDQQKELTQLRATDQEWAAIPAWVERSALAQVGRSVQGLLPACQVRTDARFPKIQVARSIRQLRLRIMCTSCRK